MLGVIILVWVAVGIPLLGVFKMFELKTQTRRIIRLTGGLALLSYCGYYGSNMGILLILDLILAVIYILSSLTGSPKVQSMIEKISKKIDDKQSC